MTTPRTPAVPGYGWLIGMSTWMLLTVIPGAVTTWLGFAIIGFVARKPKWLITSVVFGALAFLVTLEIWGDWQPVVSLLLYLAGMLTALFTNPAWLRTMWERRVGGAAAAAREGDAKWHKNSASAAARSGAAAPVTRAERRRIAREAAAERRRLAAERTEREQAAKAAAAAAAAAAAQDAEARKLAEAAGAASDEYFAPAEPREPARPAKEEPAAPAEPIDVNTATARELEQLPGVDRRKARKAVEEREAQGGFTSVEDFGESIGLQPHEIVRLRAVATCSARPRGERRFGRRVDY